MLLIFQLKTLVMIFQQKEIPLFGIKGRNNINHIMQADDADKIHLGFHKNFIFIIMEEDFPPLIKFLGSSASKNGVGILSF